MESCEGVGGARTGTSSSEYFIIVPYMRLTLFFTLARTPNAMNATYFRCVRGRLAQVDQTNRSPR